MVLGATRREVMRMVVGDALIMVCAGLVVGIPLAAFGKQLAASFMEGLPASIASPILMGTLAMVAVALVAASIPARRAASVDPMEALRHE